MTGDQKPPPELEAIARKVLAYKPKPKSKPAKARKRRVINQKLNVTPRIT